MRTDRGREIRGLKSRRLEMSEAGKVRIRTIRGQARRRSFLLVAFVRGPGRGRRGRAAVDNAYRPPGRRPSRGSWRTRKSRGAFPSGAVPRLHPGRHPAAVQRHTALVSFTPTADGRPSSPTCSYYQPSVSGCRPRALRRRLCIVAPRPIPAARGRRGAGRLTINGGVVITLFDDRYGLAPRCRQADSMRAFPADNLDPAQSA